MFGFKCRCLNSLLDYSMWIVSESLQLVVCLTPVGHSRLFAILNNITIVKSDFWSWKTIIVHQRINISRKNRDFEILMGIVFLTSKRLPPPRDFSKLHIFSKICCFTLESLFRHPEQKNRCSEENIFWPRNYVPLTLKETLYPLPLTNTEPSLITKMKMLMVSIRNVFFYPGSASFALKEGALHVDLHHIIIQH